MNLVEQCFDTNFTYFW